jgi:hypothetical protein
VTLSGDQLAAELHRLGVPYVHGAGGSSPLAPADLLAGLAASGEARLRVALIPLLLWRPHLASAAREAVQRCSPTAQTVLTCYYTAAHILQKKQAHRLDTLGVESLPLPDLFSEQLGLASSGDSDRRLTRLARRHAELSGDFINWRGTYEHAADTFLARQERALRWISSGEKRASPFFVTSSRAPRGQASAR